VENKKRDKQILDGLTQNWLRKKCIMCGKENSKLRNNAARFCDLCWMSIMEDEDI